MAVTYNPHVQHLSTLFLEVPLLAALQERGLGYNRASRLALLVRRLAHRLHQTNKGGWLDGHKWYYNTYQGWLAELPAVFSKTQEIRDVIREGRASGWLITEQRQRHNLYRIDFEKVQELYRTQGVEPPRWTSWPDGAGLEAPAEKQYPLVNPHPPLDKADNPPENPMTRAFEEALVRLVLPGPRDEYVSDIHDREWYRLDAIIKDARDWSERTERPVDPSRATQIRYHIIDQDWVTEPYGHVGVARNFFKSLCTEDDLSQPWQPEIDSDSDGVAAATRAKRTDDDIDQEADAIWREALTKLQEQVTRPNFATWLKDTRGISSISGQFEVGAPSEFVAEMLEQRMYSMISRALETVTGDEDWEIAFSVIDSQGVTESQAEAARV